GTRTGSAPQSAAVRLRPLHRTVPPAGAATGSVGCMIRVTVAAHYRSGSEVLLAERADVESLGDAQQALCDLAGELDKHADAILGGSSELVIRVAAGSYEPMPATRPTPTPSRQVRRDGF